MEDWTDVYEGWLYGEWETGPWWGFHTKEKAFATYGWVSSPSSKLWTFLMNFFWPWQHIEMRWVRAGLMPDFCFLVAFRGHNFLIRKKTYFHVKTTF